MRKSVSIDLRVQPTNSWMKTYRLFQTQNHIFFTCGPVNPLQQMIMSCPLVLRNFFLLSIPLIPIKLFFFSDDSLIKSDRLGLVWKKQSSSYSKSIYQIYTVGRVNNCYFTLCRQKIIGSLRKGWYSIYSEMQRE